MQAFVIEGGKPLSGTVRAAGNKNGALPILAATVLASEPVQLSNVPRIRDVQTMVELLIDVGADAEWIGENEIRIDPTISTRSCAAASALPSCSPVRCSRASAPRPCRRRAAT
jgi:UDP-N-acetylglucosamine enolpyruvyl transferase